MNTFGEKLKYARIMKKLTQEGLSQLCGISVQSIINYEKDKVIPRPSNIKKLAEVLEVSEQFLIDENCTTPNINELSISEDDINIDKLISESKLLLAGGKYSMEDKEKFIEAITMQYYACKAKARKDNEST